MALSKNTMSGRLYGLVQGIYGNTNKLIQHKKYKHQDVKLRTCEKCGQIYANRAELYGHYINDHPKYPNPVKVDNDYVCKCDICDKILASPTALYTHKKLTHKMKVAIRDNKVVSAKDSNSKPLRS